MIIIIIITLHFFLIKTVPLITCKEKWLHLFLTVTNSPHCIDLLSLRHCVLLPNFCCVYLPIYSTSNSSYQEGTEDTA